MSAGHSPPFIDMGTKRTACLMMQINFVFNWISQILTGAFVSGSERQESCYINTIFFLMSKKTTLSRGILTLELSFAGSFHWSKLSCERLGAGQRRHAGHSCISAPPSPVSLYFCLSGQMTEQRLVRTSVPSLRAPFSDPL